MEKSIPKKEKMFTIKQMTLIGVMTAVACVLGPFAVPLPFSPVPLSLTNLVVYFAVYLLGMKAGTVSYLVYLLVGAIGMPVFSGFSGGVGKMAGPTGGYLLGFIFMAIICGAVIDRFPTRRGIHVLGMVIGTMVCYLFGTVWLAGQLGISFVAALGVGVLPYLPGDAAKILLAVFAGPKLRREVKRLEGK